MKDIMENGMDAFKFKGISLIINSLSRLFTLSLSFLSFRVFIWRNGKKKSFFFYYMHIDVIAYHRIVEYKIFRLCFIWIEGGHRSRRLHCVIKTYKFFRGCIICLLLGHHRFTIDSRKAVSLVQCLFICLYPVYNVHRIVLYGTDLSMPHCRHHHRRRRCLRRLRRRHTQKKRTKRNACKHVHLKLYWHRSTDRLQKAQRKNGTEWFQIYRSAMQSTFFFRIAKSYNV